MLMKVLSCSIADELFSHEERARRRGPPMLGSAPADAVPVRLDPDLKQAVEARAAADHTTASEIIRRALRRFLDVA